MIIKRLIDPEQAGYALGYSDLDSLEERKLSLVKNSDLEVLEKLVFIAFQELRSEGGRFPPESYKEIHDLFDLLNDLNNQNILLRLRQLFENGE